MSLRIMGGKGNLGDMKQRDVIGILKVTDRDGSHDNWNTNSTYPKKILDK